MFSNMIVMNPTIFITEEIAPIQTVKHILLSAFETVFCTSSNKSRGNQGISNHLFCKLCFVNYALKMIGEVKLVLFIKGHIFLIAYQTEGQDQRTEVHF